MQSGATRAKLKGVKLHRDNVAALEQLQGSGQIDKLVSVVEG